MFEFLIIDDPSFNRIDQKHTTRFQPALGHDLFGGDENGANLGGANYDVFVGDDISARTKAVSIKIGSAVATVTEGEKSRSIPRLLKTGCPVVESLFLGFHDIVALPRLWDEHHNGFGKGENAINDEQFQNVIERGRIRTAGLNNRVEEIKLFSK